MNTFGSATLQFPLCDPAPARGGRVRFSRDALPLLDRVNTFYTPSGRWPFRGWVLLERYRYDQLDRFSTDLRLDIGGAVLLKNLSVVQARCVTRGLAADPNALYLVELTDDRGVLHNEWFQAPITAAYNIRAPAYPQTFHPSSMNSGTTWTWATMLRDMWTQLAALGSGGILNVWPGLPTTPAGTPEGFWLPGVPCWHALCDILDNHGLTVACDLTSSTPYTIVHSGANDTTLDALRAKYAGQLEDDLEWIDLGAGRIPVLLKILFRRRNSVYGTEENVRYDSLQWDMTPYYAVSVAAPATFAAASGTHALWHDFTVRYDQDGAPMVEDVTTAAALAAEKAADYYAAIYDQTSGYLTQTYAGALPFVTGAKVDGVCYYQDYRCGPGAWRTQVVRGPSPPWPDLYNC